MPTSESSGNALWVTAAGEPQHPPLVGDLEVDVAVIGGGIVGLTAAWMLAQEGRSVAVLEGGRIGTRATGLSTAKVTSQHGLIYSRLRDSRGLDGAQQYADANEFGRRELQHIVETLAIDCDFEPQDAYVYTTREESLDQLRTESEVAHSLGLPARFTTTAPLPFRIAGAVMFEQQAQFDPYAYLAGLGGALATRARVFEDTRVLGVRNETPYRVLTERGSLRAPRVIVATQLPVLDRGMYFARAFPFAHAVIAARLERPAPPGMYISVDDPTRSIRGAVREGSPYLVVSGPRVPIADAASPHAHAGIEAFAQEHFPVRAVTHRWTNIDYESPDEIPLVGPILPGNSRILVATGFAGWGFSNGTAAARMLADRVLERSNPWAELFDPMRLPRSMSALASLVGHNLEAAKTLAGGRVSRAPASDPSALGPGEGEVFELGGEKVAVSREADGELCAVSAICTHIGCVVEWNHTMRTWDCPCHASVFAPTGEVVRGPATAPLERKEITAPAGR